MSGAPGQGGHWDPYDTITNVDQQNGIVTGIDWSAGGQSGSFSPLGMTLNGFDQTLQTYSAQVTTVSVGLFFNSFGNPKDHFAIGVGGSALYGLNPRSLSQFLKYKFTHLYGGPGVPGAVTQQLGGRGDESAIIPMAPLQAAMVQNGIAQGIVNPPNYDVGGGPYTCDCASWAQQVLGRAGLNTGSPTQLPIELMNQINALYPQLW